ncbi:MAG: PD-(D/E)XK nuclease family protein [Bifidobacteriaceae bacterium]|jgi:superfamily I DNA/RNA helicase/RecB family exonuclease|nr:PD-(D/E)XK nuclease family protein [Bifidobacteriaceae bacterium]
MEKSRSALKLDARPRPAPRVQPDRSQEAVLRVIEQGVSVSVFGFPGTGKTLLAELAAAGALASGMDGRRLVVLSADRHSAAELSARIVSRVASVVEGRPAVTPTSLAMTILQARAEAVAGAGLDGTLEAARAYQPQMVTGAEQSAVLASLLEAEAEGLGLASPWPSSIPPQARRLTAFRDELRDLLMRAAERGIDAVELARLGRDHGRPDWVASAHFYQRYLDTLDLRNTADAGLKLDAAAMVAQAHLCLRDWEQPLSVRGQLVELDVAARPGWDLVIVDDYQEASLALHRLVGQLAQGGSQVVCLGSPDTAAQSFRGALPGQLALSTGPAPGGWGAREAVLENCWRQSGPLHAQAVEVARRLRPGGRSRAAVAPPAATGPTRGRTGAVTVGSAGEVAAVIARRLREAHATQGLAFADMAVLTRTAGQVALLRSLLAGAGVPVRVPGSEVLATDHPAVAPLVMLMRWAGHGAPPEDGSDEAGTGSLSALSPGPAAVVGLLTSSVGALDAADLRELRRALARAGRQAGLAVPPDLLVVGLLGDTLGAGFEDAVPERLRPRVERLQAALRAGRAAAGRKGAGAAEVLWAIWDASQLSRLWSNWALAGGLRGARADADLDAVLALFAAAARHDARKPGSGPAGFVSYLEAQELPSDTIAAQAPPGDRVTVSTATAAVGREWDLVALVGLEEDVWPDLRLRDTLLGSGRLADIVDGKDVSTSGPERRREVLEEETRSFALALTRAKREVLAVAVANTDQQPSRFFHWLSGGGPSGRGGPDADREDPDRGGQCGGQPGGEVARRPDHCDGSAERAQADAACLPATGARCWPFDLRGIVAEARARLTGLGSGGAGSADLGLPDLGPAGVGSPGLGRAGERNTASGAPAQPTGQELAGGAAQTTGQGPAGRAALAVEQDDAARVLAVLSAVGVDGADPTEWPGLVEASAPAALDSGGRGLVLSPSKVEALSKCPLAWALEKAGGGREAGRAATLGTLIHWLAEEYPHDGPAELCQRLRKHWPELGLDDGYSSRRLLEEALEMARRLGVYQEAHPDLVASEAEIKRPEPGSDQAPGSDLPVGLAGRIDRLEAAGPDGVRVVDFKTGKAIPSALETQTNAQLGSYQLAVNAGLVPPHRAANGAVLVYLSRGTGPPAERRQAPLPRDGESNWMVELLSQCAQDAQGPVFEARPGPQCRNCAVKTSCPARPEGRQVIA